MSLNENDIALYKKCSEIYDSYLGARSNLIVNASSKVAIVAYAIKKNRLLALELIRYLSPEELKEIAQEILEEAVYYSWATDSFMEILFKIDFDWLKNNIETLAERLLNQEEDVTEEYKSLLYIYTQLDAELGQKLLQRALKTDVPDTLAWANEVLADKW